MSSHSDEREWTNHPIYLIRGRLFPEQLPPTPTEQPSSAGTNRPLLEPVSGTMNLTRTKIYKVIARGNHDQILQVSREFVRSGKDPNFRDPATGGNLLHHIVSHSDNFLEPETVSVVYALCAREIEVDAQDLNGDTALHCVVRQRGAYRIMVALIRCGIDTELRNSTGMTAEDILHHERPVGHEEMLHWYTKFRPGLWRALQEDKPDLRAIERLLRSWCGLTTVKKGHVVNMKSLVQGDAEKLPARVLLETYERTTKLALTLLGGLGFMVRQWARKGDFQNVDANTRDMSYQVRYPDFPESSQPLVAAVWETNSLEAVDALLNLGGPSPDTGQLYYTHKDRIPWPASFHLFRSPYRPKDSRIIHRVLETTDISVRNPSGQTLLFQAIESEESLATVSILLRKGVNLAARDCKGRTARDFAMELGRIKYAKAIDAHVIQLVRNREYHQVEQLLLESYDPITTIVDPMGRPLVDIAKRFSSDQVHEIVRLADPIQQYAQRVFRAVEEGSHDDLQKLLSCRKYGAVRDQCGRTPLLRALLRCRRGLVMKLVNTCPFTLNMQDSLGRSALHYANLFMEDPDMLKILDKSGADKRQVDNIGRAPKMYNKSVCGLEEFSVLQRKALDADLDIYIYNTNFEAVFYQAMKKGDLPTIQQLVTGLKDNGDVSRFSHLLFACVDLCREDIALYLLNTGFSADIWKPYSNTKGDPLTLSLACSANKCSPLKSLRQRAMETGCRRVVRFINKQDHIERKANVLQREATSMLNYGLM